MIVNYKNLSGTVVVITGGARGIGLATAKACLAQGAQVSIGDIDGDLAVSQAKKIGGFGHALDVRKRDSFESFLQATEDKLGPIDVLINNAGIMPTGAFVDESDNISETQIDINLNGVILGCKLALPRMIRRGRGHIVNVSSMAGVVPIPGLAVYCATKFAVVGLTKTLREEYRDTGINFSTIMPCKVTTELALGSDDAAKGVPTSTPEEIAAAVLKSIAHELTEVTIPSYLGYSPAILNLTPHRVTQGFRRLFGDRRVLENLNEKERSSYTQRINNLVQ